jgi:hypothetical protein
LLRLRSNPSSLSPESERTPDNVRQLLPDHLLPSHLIESHMRYNSYRGLFAQLGSLCGIRSTVSFTELVRSTSSSQRTWSSTPLRMTNAWCRCATPSSLIRILRSPLKSHDSHLWICRSRVRMHSARCLQRRFVRDCCA